MIFEKSCMVAVVDIRSEFMKQPLENNFSPEEIRRYSRPQAFRSLCTRYLAKKMIIEQLGKGLNMPELSIENEASGAPELHLMNEQASSWMKEKGVRKIHLSFTHTRAWIGVFLIIDYF